MFNQVAVKGVLEMLVKLIKLFVQLWVLGVMFHDIKVLKLENMNYVDWVIDKFLPHVLVSLRIDCR